MSKPDANGWMPIETAPMDETEVLIWTPDGPDIGWFTEKEDDCPDQPGHNPGWWSYRGVTWPGRSREHGFGGGDSWIHAPQCQPAHWQPLPEPPVDGGDE